MKRRSAVLALLAVCAMPRVRAQSRKPARIGYLTGYSAEIDRPLLAAFKQGLQELGYAEGRDVVIDVRHAGGQPQEMDALARELAARKPDIYIAGGGAAAALSLRKVSGAAPIVMANVQDPLTSGLVASLSKPGGNITGMSDFRAASVPKRVQLMHEVLPSMKVLGVLWNEDSPPSVKQFKDVERAAAQIGLKVVSLPMRKPADIEGALQPLRNESNAGLLMLGDFVLTTNMARIAALTLEYGIPAAYTLRGFAERGGFMSYGTNFPDLYRRSARYVDRIFKGAKPGELPVEQPTKFDLVINLKTAKALGLAVAPAFLVRADHVIQ